MKIKILPWTLVILWMAVIFIFSHQPATESSDLSSGITKTIADIITSTAPDIKLNQESLHFFIRKCAHFGVYLILGLLVANGLSHYNMSGLKVILLAFLLCGLYAISDEIHQLYVQGRSGQVSDVLIDSSGALVGILSIVAIRSWLIKKRNKQNI